LSRILLSIGLRKDNMNSAYCCDVTLFAEAATLPAAAAEDDVNIYIIDHKPMTHPVVTQSS